LLKHIRDKAKQRTEFDLLEAVHASEYGRLSTPPDPAHRFEVNLEPADFTEEKFKLFENYQRHVHHEKPSEISRHGFKRFLCDSPIVRTTREVDGKEQKLGSYHQCYRIDGRLIAIGVLDLLPHCVSGVYFIYHSDFEQFSFGKISALREAALALEESYDYYYMGYYIHSCQKMRYKGNYKPQRILDPDTLEWCILDDRVKKLLDQKPYVSIKRELEEMDKQDKIENPDVDKSESPGEEFSTVAEASEAAADGTALCRLGVPGIMSMEEIEAQVGLNDITVLLGPREPAVPAQVSNVMHSTGSSQSVLTVEQLLLDMGLASNPDILKELILDMAACVGPEVAREMAIRLSG
jgi:arginyl-tRNA---protein transferase